VAEGSKAWVCVRSPAGIESSNPAGGTDGCPLWLLCVLSDRGLCDGLITRPEESYRLWCVPVCDLETSRMRRLKLIKDCNLPQPKNKIASYEKEMAWTHGSQADTQIPAKIRCLQNQPTPMSQGKGEKERERERDRRGNGQISSTTSCWRHNRLGSLIMDDDDNDDDSVSY
jgi:hypothetical protein